MGLAAWYASLARARFLNDDPVEDVRAEFATASRHIIKSFTMAYDETDPDFQGVKVDWSEVIESIAIDGFNYALMAADFNLAAELGKWFRDPGDGDLMDSEVNQYAHGLAQTVTNSTDKIS